MRLQNLGDRLCRNHAEALAQPFGRNGAALCLDRDVLAIAEPVDQPVDAAVGQRQKHVQRASRLLRHRGPEAELEDLPGGAQLVGRPRGYRVDEATLTYISRA